MAVTYIFRIVSRAGRIFIMFLYYEFVSAMSEPARYGGNGRHYGQTTSLNNRLAGTPRRPPTPATLAYYKL